MKTLLRSSLLALLAVGAFAGVATKSTTKFGILGGTQTCPKCASTTTTTTTQPQLIKQVN